MAACWLFASITAASQRALRPRELGHLGLPCGHGTGPGKGHRVLVRSVMRQQSEEHVAKQR